MMVSPRQSLPVGLAKYRGEGKQCGRVRLIDLRQDDLKKAASRLERSGYEEMTNDEARMTNDGYATKQLSSLDHSSLTA
jgi:hypothetical protein